MLRSSPAPRRASGRARGGLRPRRDAVVGTSRSIEPSSEPDVLTVGGDARSGSPSALASMTKGGLAAVARSLAIEYAARGVRVNAVSLGVIKTPMHNPSEYDAMAAVHPLGGDASSWRVHQRTSLWLGGDSDFRILQGWI